MIPDKNGHFGDYGGIFVSETLMYALKELDDFTKNLKLIIILITNFKKS